MNRGAVANRRRKQDTRRSRRERKGEPAKRKVAIPLSPGKLGIESKASSPARETSGRGPREDSSNRPDESPANPPGTALGDLSYIRGDLVRILSLAAVMLVILVATVLAFG